MTEVEVLLKTEQDVIGMTGIISKYPYDADMILGRNVVDAKSILGVLSIGIGKMAKLCINAEDTDALIQELSPYLCQA